MDQFIEGLQELQIIDLIKQYPEKMKSLFVATSGCLTTGILYNVNFILMGWLYNNVHIHFKLLA